VSLKRKLLRSVAAGDGLKGYAEIKRVFTDELGFVDLAAYRRWVETRRAEVVITPELVDRLSPDHVDCRAFWRVCEELFGSDPVCNQVLAPAVGVLPHGVGSDMDANRLNLRLAKSFAITAFLDENAHERLKTLEIGPGFGSLKHYIETHTNHLYTGVDVHPRFPGLIETTIDGLIPESLVAGERHQYAYVISSNVFQHLSARQRSRYYSDAHSLLQAGGLFIFNLHVDTGKLGAHPRDAEGRAWCDHYGQYTLIPKSDLFDELAPMFEVLYLTQRYDGVFNLVCRNRA
jgi:hypothetical protein